MKLHYSTQRILNLVSNQINNCAAIHYNDIDTQEEPISLAKEDWDTEPETIEFINKLNNLFENGYQYIIEAATGSDDEGGNGYEFYILKPGYKSHFDCSLNYDKPHQKSWHLELMKYIINNPNSYITIWAGPY